MNEISTQITEINLFLHLKFILNISINITSFFKRKKRDLSYTLNEKCEITKVKEKERENSLNLSLSKDNTAIFKEVIESQVALVFYNCLQNLNKISEISSSMKKAQIKGIRHMEEVNKSIKFINENFEEMESKKNDKFWN